MQYFRQSLISIPSYIPPTSIADIISLYQIDDIINAPIDPKDRRDLNKIYEQSDIFVKKNSIVTINNKKQKKFPTILSGLSHGLSKPNNGKQETHPTLHIMRKEGALFQEVHPADVQKNHDDSIFDYRLHMKLAKGEQIFKVEQVKRKQKKRITKQCSCCGKQVTRNHKCAHTVCERKCGKASLLRGNSRKDVSSIWSDSKDENWSQENYDQDKLNKVMGDKKSGRNHHSSQQNNQAHNFGGGEPSEYLLNSIEKLITDKVANNFSYRVIEIKEYEQEQEESGSIDEQNEEKEMEFQEEEDQSGEHNVLFGVNMLTSLNKVEMEVQESNEAKLVNQTQQVPHLVTNKPQIIEEVESQGQSQVQSREQGDGQRKDYKKKSNQCLKSKEINNQQIIYKQVNGQQMQQQKNEDNQQYESQQAEGEQKQNQNQQQTRQQQDKKQPSRQSANQQTDKIPISSNVYRQNDHSRIPSSDSSDSQIDEPEIEDLPEQAKIPIDDEDKDQLLDNKIGEDLINQSEESKISQMEDLPQPMERSSLPDLGFEEDSLDDEIEEIIEPTQQVELGKSQDANKPLSSLKLSKKQSKKLKMIEKQILKSDMIEEIDPMLEEQQVQKEHQHGKQKESGPAQSQARHGRGKGRGMGRGKGILEEELDIYSEDSQMLEENLQLNEDNELFQNLEEKPVIAQPKLSSLSQPQIQPPSSPMHHGMTTPKRRIPNMSTIIEQIKVQSKSIEESKGLGRGKIFGRGLGVMEQTEELEKQLQEDKLVIRAELKARMPKKKVKLEQTLQKDQNGSGKNISSQLLNEQQELEMIDKFDELIQEKVLTVQICRESDSMGEDQKEGSVQSMDYMRYLDKKETIIQPLERDGYSSSEEGGKSDQEQEKGVVDCLSKDGIGERENFLVELEQRQIDNIQHDKQEEIMDFLGENLSEDYKPRDKHP